VEKKDLSGRNRGEWAWFHAFRGDILKTKEEHAEPGTEDKGTDGI
jgi:hypothetical protein